MNFLAKYIMKGRVQSIMVASSLALLSLLLPPVSIVSSASVALVTLRKGAYEGLYVLISACFSAALLGAFLVGSFQAVLFYGLGLWIPVWVIAIVLREGKHLTVALEIAVFLGILGVVCFYLYADSPVNFWSAELTRMIQPMLENAGSDFPVEKVKQSVQMFSPYMTGSVAAMSVYGLLFGLFLARWWQSNLYNPGGFKAEYLSLKVQPKLALVSIIVAGFAWFMSGAIAELGWNIFILFGVLYIFVGASVLHTAFSTMKTRRFMVPFLYVTLILAPLVAPHVIIIVMIVGLLDSWLNLRSKISNNTGT